MQLDFEFEASNNEKYKVDDFWDSPIYAKKSIIGQLPGLYYLILWKGYSKKENIWEPVLAIQDLWKLTIAYHKTNSKKPIVTFLSVITALLMARPMVTPTKKHNQPAKSTTTITITK